MHRQGDFTPDVALARELVDELVRTGLTFADTLASLIEELPESAFPGEDHAQVLLEMAAGTCAPVINAAGQELCRDAVGLVGAMRQKFLSDLRTAANLAASRCQEE
jgi:hypothetical protein